MSELEVGRIVIRRILREDDVVINVRKSDNLPFIDALGMIAFAQQFLGDIYEIEAEEPQ